MSPVRPLLVAVVSLVALPMIAEGATAGTTTGSANTTIAIDGVAAGAVLGWEGGDPRASVVPGPTSSEGTVTKQPGAAVCAPLVVKCAFPPAGPLRDWLGELLSNQTSLRKIVLTDYDSTGATRETEFSGATLTQAGIPAFDAADSTAGIVTLIFKVRESRVVTPAAATVGAATRAAGATFRLAVDGLEGSGVMRTGPISIVREMTDGEFLEARVSTTAPGTIAFSNLTVTLAHANSSTWRTWFTDFVINGNGSDKNEKNGTLEILSADMKQVVFALRFERMGILRVSRVNAAAGAPQLDQAELYFEKLSIGPASTATSASDSSSESETSDTQDGTSDTSGVSEGKEGETETGDTENSQDLSGGDGTDPSGATELNVGNRFVDSGASVSDSTSTPTRAGTVLGSTSIATTTTTNPSDQGSRDPAGFPRVEGLTRLDFSGQYHTTSTSEESHYTTPDKIYDLLARIDAAAKAAGWTLAHFAEGYSQGERWVTEQWKKDNIGVALEIDQPDTGITRYWIRVTTQIPESN